MNGVIREDYKVLLNPLGETWGTLAQIPPEQTLVHSSEERIGTGKREVSEHGLGKGPKKGKQADGMLVELKSRGQSA